MRKFLSALLFIVFAAPLSHSAEPNSSARAANVIEVDASSPFNSPPPTEYEPGSATSPSGKTIGLNSRYLLLNGKPWLPVMGEFHYSRYPEQQWEEEILKMKAGGVQIIATYIFWIHVEEVEGQYDWSGQRDLRRFVELCAKHGMYVYPRIGPWAHGEARNGGLPDWLLKKGPTRRNDPGYLSYVDQYFSQIADQLKGLLWKDGGPVIGIQLENEYGVKGAGAGTEHILKLKEMAIQKGLDVPLYTITGWDNVPIPRKAVLPVSGGYPDEPWNPSLEKLPANEVYAFRPGRSASGDVDETTEAPAYNLTATPQTPWLTAEIGGGVQDTYHRRIVVQPDDVAAIFPVKIGSGVNLYGTYMFQGGENPDGKLSTLQEVHTTEYATDVPVKSYDFQAPLSEFGTERELFRKLKVFNYFLNDFGADLAPMVVHAPAIRPASPADLSVLRLSVRSEEQKGFLFVNNYVRGYSMPARKATQVRIKLPGEILNVPDSPVNIPSGAYFIWPFNMKLGAATLRYSTAQLFARIANGTETIYFFVAVPGITSEFAFERTARVEIQASGIVPANRGSFVLVRDTNPHRNDFSISIRNQEGARDRIVLLSQQEAENAWRVRIDASERMLFTNQQFFADEDHAYLQSDGDPHFLFSVMPAPQQKMMADHPLRLLSTVQERTAYSAALSPSPIALHYEKIKDADAVPPVRTTAPLPYRKERVAEAPEDGDFDKAARWSIHFPGGAMNGLSDLFLKVQYVGDAARLSAASRLLADNFYNGTPWLIGLKRFDKEMSRGALDLSILPLRKDAPIFMEDGLRPTFHAKDQLGELNKLTLVPQYQLVINIAP
jgi:beta-galactosidase